ncbi:hypothetical protein K1T71_008464 [Dendrolimus kikuchii]|uniref:Uncharacterized protein n=1 Tax=Dendrolimus kikuchii TaxID=765133 RepID=A0ACC1CXK0_9NEOP|nr:hypothetical protein K1T71_008464 [Dendrolimus kikuchii]
MLFIVSVAVLLASVQAKFYTDCGSKLATVQSVGVSNCAETARDCILKRNTNVTISLEFTPKEDVSSLTTDVHGIIMNLPVPFPLPQPDACKGNGLTCPLKAGQKESYEATLQVLKSYPKVNVDVKWELKNENDDDLVCVLIRAKLQ